jgi:hypothetical protein
METNLIQITSACVVLVSSLVPLYFVLGAKAERQRLLSVILFVVLQAYVVHSLIESFELVGTNYQVFAKLCFVVSTFGLTASYSFFQIKAKHALIGGMFGLVMTVTFAIWMIGELAEATLAFENETVEYVSSIVMASFGIFLIARYLWIRKIVLAEARV